MAWQPVPSVTLMGLFKIQNGSVVRSVGLWFHHKGTGTRYESFRTENCVVICKERRRLIFFDGEARIFSGEGVHSF